MLSPFYRFALYLGKKDIVKRVFMKSNSQTYRDLKVLYPDASVEASFREFWAKKLGLCLTIIFIAVCMGFLLSVKASSNIILSESGKVPRETDGVSTKQIVLQGRLENGNTQNFSISVEPQMLMGEKLKEVQEQFHVALPQLILEENESLLLVSSDLLLCDSYEGYPFRVFWRSSHPNLVSSWGSVYKQHGQKPHAPERVLLTADITYGDISWEESIEVWVADGAENTLQDVGSELQSLLLSSEELSRQDKVWSLPQNYGDEVIQWKQQIEDNGPLVFFLGAIVAVLIYFMSDFDLHKRLIKRQAGMKQEYVDIVSSLTLYLEAGMTIRGAMLRMCADKGEKVTPIFEEMKRACRELQSGVPECVVYETLGKRTGLQEYIRLSTLLSQNLLKGNSTLLERLREEMQRASAEKLQMTKRLGEEAGTKLLVPTTMLLAVVMIMIMIPAFSSISL